jgi:hypothetical protein
MARKRGYKYLGKRVKDTGLKGLDKPREFRGIARAIVRDFRKGKIGEKTARGRLLLLLRLSKPKNNSKVRGWSPRTRVMVQNYIRRMMRSL